MDISIYNIFLNVYYIHIYLCVFMCVRMHIYSIHIILYIIANNVHWVVHFLSYFLNLKDYWWKSDERRKIIIFWTIKSRIYLEKYVNQTKDYCDRCQKIKFISSNVEREFKNSPSNPTKSLVIENSCWINKN